MSAQTILEQKWRVREGDTDVGAINYTDFLDSGESLTGTPTVVEVTTTDLTLDNKAVNTASLTILNETATAGTAIQFSFTGQKVTNSPYQVRVTCGTDSTPARTVERIQVIIVES